MAYRKVFRRVKRSRAPKGKKAVIRKALRNNASKNIARVVKKVLARKAETKQAWSDTFNFTVNEPINANSDVKFILPNITQGTDEAARIGNSIYAKALYIKGHVMIQQPYGGSTSLLQYASSYGRVCARVFCLTYRPQPSQVPASSGMYNNLLQKGATTGPWTGAISDLYSQVNQELYTVHYDKKFYLQMDSVNTIGTESAGFTVSVDGRDSLKFFSFKIPYNKVFKYPDGGLQPVNANPFIVIGWCKMNGAAIDADNQLLTAQAVSNFYYTDM